MISTIAEAAFYVLILSGLAAFALERIAARRQRRADRGREWVVYESAEETYDFDFPERVR